MQPIALTPADAGEVLTLQRAAYTTEAQLYGDPFIPALTQTLDEVRAELERPALGTREPSSGRLLAAVRWTVIGELAHIGRLVVAPDAQGRGLGTTLLQAAETASGATRFELSTGHLSIANIGMYLKLGYTEHRRAPLRPGITLVYLQKRAPYPSAG